MSEQQDIPAGLCQCGCGARTNIALKNNARDGWVAGQPIRFVAGHQHNNTRERAEAIRKLREEAKAASVSYGSCYCGCGNPAPISKMTRTHLGHIKGEPVRFIRGHDGRRPAEVRFWEKVDKRGPDECWLWTASRYTNGYGMFGERKGCTRPAHRFAYELVVGPIPDGLQACHHCDTPLCVNPAHIFLGTQADNVADMVRKGRAFYAQRNGAKLTPAQVREIRQRYTGRRGQQTDLAREYGVLRRTIWSIVHGHSWKDLL